MSHEPLWVTWWLDFHSQSNRENESQKWQKPRIFEEISKYFSWLEVSLARESWNLLCKLVTGASWLAWLASESPKDRVENFWIFEKIFETKHFPKQLKYSKKEKKIVFDQHMIEYVQHI